MEVTMADDLRQGLGGGTLAWLLEPADPGVRYLALRDMVGLPRDDPELLAAKAAAHTSAPIAAVLDSMDPAGFWVSPGPGYNPKYRASVWSLILLAQLGADMRYDPRIARACDQILATALTEHGQFTASGAPSGTADCLHGNLCTALLALGCDDPRLERAFDWLARSVTGEGIAPAADRAAAVRYYASGKCGPLFACGANGGQPCAWGAVKVLLALGAWPAARRTQLHERAIKQGIDFIFSCDPATAGYPSYTGRPSGNWWKFGFPVFYVTDLLQLVEALVRLGYGGDPRLASALACVRDKADAQGRWALDYDYTGKTWIDFGPKGQPNKWVSLRALVALRGASAARMASTTGT
jgi:hypothetical protein